MSTVGIVGLGLIGGSVAKAAKARTNHKILGFDRDEGVTRRALEDGAIDGVLDRGSLPGCKLLLLAVYPSAAAEFVLAFEGEIRPGALVVDLCGVKRAVCEAVAPAAERRGFLFVGGHPMAGRERSGYQEATAELFSGAPMLLTPPKNAPEAALVEIEAFFLSLGFRAVRRTSPDEHDSIIAYTSQLAHVLSNAYVKSPRALESRDFSGGSFQDLTRVAFLNEAMWSELFLHNRDNLIGEIDGLCERLSAYSSALRKGDEGALRALLREGSQWKERIAQGRE